MKRSTSRRLRMCLATVTACALTTATVSAAPEAAAEPAPAAFAVPVAAPFGQQDPVMTYGPIAAILAVVAAIIGVVSSGGSSGSPEPHPGTEDSSRIPAPAPVAPQRDADTTEPDVARPGESEGTSPRAINPDDANGGVVSTKGPDSGGLSDPGYDLNQPTPGVGGMSVTEARRIIADSLNKRRVKKGLPPLNFPELAQSIAEDEAVILGKEVTRIGSHGMRNPNVNNWVANYPELRDQPWWNTTVPPAAWVARSDYAGAPTHIISRLTSTTKAYSNAGIGVWRDPVTGTWFVAIAFFG